MRLTRKLLLFPVLLWPMSATAGPDLFLTHDDDLAVLDELVSDRLCKNFGGQCDFRVRVDGCSLDFVVDYPRGRDWQADDPGGRKRELVRHILTERVNSEACANTPPPPPEPSASGSGSSQRLDDIEARLDTVTALILADRKTRDDRWINIEEPLLESLQNDIGQLKHLVNRPNKDLTAILLKLAQQEAELESLQTELDELDEHDHDGDIDAALRRGWLEIGVVGGPDWGYGEKNPGGALVARGGVRQVLGETEETEARGSFAFTLDSPSTLPELEARYISFSFGVGGWVDSLEPRLGVGLEALMSYRAASQLTGGSRVRVLPTAVLTGQWAPVELPWTDSSVLVFQASGSLDLLKSHMANGEVGVFLWSPRVGVFVRL